jgi:flagellar biosynthesis GTPase FlhF
MDVKTFTDSSIQAALEKARHKLGDQVVLVESTPATEDAPARVAVMVDEPTKETSPQRERSWGHVPKPSEAAPSTTKTAPDPEGPATPDVPTGDDGTGADDGDSTAASRFQSELAAQSGRAQETSQGPGRGRVFPSSPQEEAESSTTGDHEAWVESRLEELRTRQGGGHDTDRQRPDPGHAGRREWAGHPLFESLLDGGLRSRTATSLFDDLAARGVDPDESPRDDLHWALAQVLCRRIQTDPSGPETGVLALVGPSGAGKTSLALKLAVHDRMFGAQDTAVIHLLPDEEHHSSYQNPTDLYRRFGLPVRSVRTEEDMAKALSSIRDFEQVVVDTPPLPMPLVDARPVLRRFARLLRPLPAPAVHFVVDATRALGGLEETSLSDLPLSPTAAAVTHLDEVYRWGQVAEWLLHVDLPVQLVSEGPEVPDGARAFSLQWFVEDVMDL